MIYIIYIFFCKRKALKAVECLNAKPHIWFYDMEVRAFQVAATLPLVALALHITTGVPYCLIDGGL